MTNPRPFQISDETKAIVASHLASDPASVRWVRFPTSCANYVYRAKAKGKSVVIKASDNVATVNDYNIPDRHLLHEYEFLKIIEDLGFPGIQFPQALSFVADNNALVMSDLGKARWLLQGPKPALWLNRKTFSTLGQALALIHDYPFPESFINHVKEHGNPKLLFDYKLGEDPLLENFDFVDSYAASEPQGFALLDFGPRNILRTKPMSIIDFDFISYGYQYFDLANFLQFGLWNSMLRKSKQLALYMGELLTAYCDTRTNGIQPVELLRDTPLLKFVFPMVYKRFLRNPDRKHRSEMRDFLTELTHTPMDTWDQVVTTVFARIKWVD